MAPNKRQRTTQSPDQEVIPSYPDEIFCRIDVDDQRTNFKKIKSRRIRGQRYINHDVLRLLNIENEFRGGLRKIGWPSLMNMDAPTYYNPTMEFVSSFRYHEQKLNAVQFRLANTDFEMTLNELGLIFGWPRLGTTTKPETGFEKRFWKELTGTPEDQFDIRNCKASKLRDVALVYFHRVLALTLYGRGECHGTVNQRELEILWCWVRGKKVDFTSYFCDRIVWQQSRGFGELICGGFVTMIAEAVGLLDRAATGMAAIMDWPSLTIDCAYGVKMGLLRKNGKEYVVLPCGPQEEADAEDKQFQSANPVQQEQHCQPAQLVQQEQQVQPAQPVLQVPLQSSEYQQLTEQIRRMEAGFQGFLGEYRADREQILQQQRGLQVRLDACLHRIGLRYRSPEPETNPTAR